MEFAATQTLTRRTPVEENNQARRMEFAATQTLTRRTPVEENNQTRRLKPRLHKQNPPPRVEENTIVEITLFLQSAEADFLCVDAVSTAVSSFQPLTLVTSKSKIQNRLTAGTLCGYAVN